MQTEELCHGYQVSVWVYVNVLGKYCVADSEWVSVISQYNIMFCYAWVNSTFSGQSNIPDL